MVATSFPVQSQLVYLGAVYVSLHHFRECASIMEEIHRPRQTRAATERPRDQGDMRCLEGGSDPSGQE